MQAIEKTVHFMTQKIVDPLTHKVVTPITRCIVDKMWSGEDKDFVEGVVATLATRTLLLMSAAALFKSAVVVSPFLATVAALIGLYASVHGIYLTDRALAAYYYKEPLFRAEAFEKGVNGKRFGVGLYTPWLMQTVAFYKDLESKYTYVSRQAETRANRFAITVLRQKVKQEIAGLSAVEKQYYDAQWEASLQREDNQEVWSLMPDEQKELSQIQIQLALIEAIKVKSALAESPEALSENSRIAQELVQELQTEIDALSESPKRMILNSVEELLRVKEQRINLAQTGTPELKKTVLRDVYERLIQSFKDLETLSSSEKIYFDAHWEASLTREDNQAQWAPMTKEQREDSQTQVQLQLLQIIKAKSALAETPESLEQNSTLAQEVRQELQAEIATLSSANQVAFQATIETLLASREYRVALAQAETSQNKKRTLLNTYRVLIADYKEAGASESEK